MGSEMRVFWERRARENPFFFIDNRLDYRRPDLDRFWAEGERDLDFLLGSLGVAVTPEDDVLEIGCGVGRLTRVLAGRARSVRAIDISARMLEIASRHNEGLANVEWILGDGSTLSPIADASIDACVSHVVFQHIPEPTITLGYVREMGRVLRAGGWAAFQLSNDPNMHRRPHLLTRLVRALRSAAGGAPRGQSEAPWLGSMIELDELSRAAREGSMDVERVLGEGTPLCCVLTRRRAA